MTLNEWEVTLKRVLVQVIACIEVSRLREPVKPCQVPKGVDQKVIRVVEYPSTISEMIDKGEPRNELSSN